jgi:hypothetical protein
VRGKNQLRITNYERRIKLRITNYKLHLTSLFILAILLLVKVSTAQELFISPADAGVEQLLDELANDRIISINSVTKPYSREFVATELHEALKKDSLLSKRQIGDVQFYLKNYKAEDRGQRAEGRGRRAEDGGPFSYDPIGFGLQNKEFAFSVRPMVNYTQFVNNNGTFYSAEAGAGFMAYLGKHVGCAVSISRTFQDCILSEPQYFTQLPGGKWNTYSDGGGSFTEWTGQLTYSWKWGSLGIYHDHFSWGDGYHGASYFSGRAAAFPFVKLHLKPAKWIEFSYIHGWLNNSEEDFALVNETDQYAFASSIAKHLSANLLTFIPWRGLDISFGNSIIYDGAEQLAYLNPFMFYKSIDHTLSYSIDNENSQLFLDLSSRQIKHLHLYLTLYVDEFKMSRIWTKDEHNFLSWKAGACLSDFPIRNLSFILEGTRTLPMTYQHYDPTLTFASDGYNLGNYLRDNSQEIYVAFIYKPVRGLSLTLSYNFAEHGDEFQYGLVPDPTVLPVLKNISWQNQCIALNASYSLVAGTVVFINYQFNKEKGDVQFTAPVFRGNTNTLSAGVQIGF